MQTRSPPATALDRAPYRDQVKNGKGCANRTAIHLRDWLPRCDNPVRVQRTVPVVSPWFRGRALCVGSLHRWTRHLSVAARHIPPSSTRKNSLQQRCLFCFAGNHRPFVWSPAFRRSGPAKAGTPCNFPRRPCFVMESVRGLDIAKKPSHGVPPWGRDRLQA